MQLKAPWLSTAQAVLCASYLLHEDTRLSHFWWDSGGDSLESPLIPFSSTSEPTVSLTDEYCLKFLLP